MTETGFGFLPVWTFQPKRVPSGGRRRQHSSKAAAACSILLQVLPDENEIGEFVRNRAPGQPTGAQGFAADFAARPTASTPRHVCSKIKVSGCSRGINDAAVGGIRFAAVRPELASTFVSKPTALLLVRLEQLADDARDCAALEAMLLPQLVAERMASRDGSKSIACRACRESLFAELTQLFAWGRRPDSESRR
jgi:hypothetical protein